MGGMKNLVQIMVKGKKQVTNADLMAKRTASVGKMPASKQKK